jgi:hypothetical protein
VNNSKDVRPRAVSWLCPLRTLNALCSNIGPSGDGPRFSKYWRSTPDLLATMLPQRTQIARRSLLLSGLLAYLAHQTRFPNQARCPNQIPKGTPTAELLQPSFRARASCHGPREHRRIPKIGMFLTSHCPARQGARRPLSATDRHCILAVRGFRQLSSRQRVVQMQKRDRIRRIISSFRRRSSLEVIC